MVHSLFRAKSYTHHMCIDLFLCPNLEPNYFLDKENYLWETKWFASGFEFKGKNMHSVGVNCLARTFIRTLMKVTKVLLPIKKMEIFHFILAIFYY